MALTRHRTTTAGVGLGRVAGGRRHLLSGPAAGRQRLVLGIATTAAAAWVWAGWQERAWDRRLVGPGVIGPGAAGREDAGRATNENGKEPRRDAVVVLGYRNAGATISVVNRGRVRRALESVDPGASTLLVCSGGATGDAPSEAALLAAHARRLGFAGEIALEGASRDTAQNIALSLPFLEHADRIVLVSEPFHALWARTLLVRLRPELGVRLDAAAPHARALRIPRAAYGVGYLREVARRSPA